MPSNQKKIRDLQRLLRRKNNGGGTTIGGEGVTESGDTATIPHDDAAAAAAAAAAADAQQGILRKIIGLQTAREDVKRNMRIRRNAIKYHMVKFLERKKVTRMIRSVDGKLKEHSRRQLQHSNGLVDEDSQQLVQMREKLLEDLAYIMYYPKEMKYVSLFPSKGHDNDDDDKPSSRDSDRSTITSAKARSIATQEWRDHLSTASATDSSSSYLSTADAADIDQGVDNYGIDKVTYAMKVEYFGGSSLGSGIMKGSDDDNAAEHVTAGSKRKKTDKAAAVVVASKHKRSSSSSSGGGALGRTTSEAVADDKETDDFFVADGDDAGDAAVRASRDSDDPNAPPRGHPRSLGNRRQQKQLSRNDSRHAATKRKFEQHKKVANSQQHRKG